MILRVKQISQIGSFRDFKHGGSVPFANEKKVTLVHAFNTLGKTTFTNILDSLGCDSPGLIQSRKSIPATAGVQQQVNISFMTIEGVQKSAKFVGGAWNNCELKDRILVFDQDFINTHVMLGNLITRDNKEEFTDFILGSKGVALSQKIENDKKTLRQEKSRLPDFRPPFVKNSLDEKTVDGFVTLKVEEDTPTLEKQRETDEKRLRRFEKITDFKHLIEPAIQNRSAENEVIRLQQEFTKILKEDYKKVSDESWKILQTHIENNCDAAESVNWLKTGLKLRKTGACPFCAQDLSKSKILIDAYQTIFDEQFSEFEKTLNQRIRALEADIRFSVAESYVAPVNTFLKQAQLFNPFIPELESEIALIEVAIKDLTTLEQDFQVELAKWSQDAQDVLSMKSKSVHKSVIDSTSHVVVIEKAKAVSQKQADIRKIQNAINRHITNAKNAINRLNTAQVEEEKRKLQSRIGLIDKKVARLAQDKESTIYLGKQENIETTRKRIDTQIAQLEAEQTAYLDKYFERLDHWFKQLGSDVGFKIKKQSTDRGDKKVYSLTIEFHGQKINPDELGKVFSESDKRNLALSIFLSKAENLTNKKQYILVFDDPVVSFDDNRRKITCREIKLLATKFRQIIVTTHYSSLVRLFVEMNMPAQYVQIVTEADTSIFKAMDPAEFAMSPHQRQCERILLFVDGENIELDKDLRPFMENHLHLRFQKQLNSERIGRIGLEDLINKLKDLGLMNNDNAEILHGFRTTFNPDHHRDGEAVNTEEVRTEARDLMDLLYGQLV